MTTTKGASGLFDYIAKNTDKAGDMDVYSKASHILINSFAYNVLVFTEELEEGLLVVLYDFLYSIVQTSKIEDLISMVSDYVFGAIVRKN